MSILLYLLGAVVLFVVAYTLARPWLKTKPWAARYFEVVEAAEIALFKKSETILFARLKTVTGVALVLLTQAGQIDVTPLLPFLKEEYRSWVATAVGLLPIALSIVGMIDEHLRKGTTKPLAEVAAKDEKA